MSFITHNLPWFIRDPGVYIIGEKCYTSLVEDLDIFDFECLKYAFSKALGIAIVVGGSVMKLPQLVLIVRARSARGISLPSYALETLAYAINLAYSSRNHFPFSTYGENLFLTIQNIIITLLIIFYAPPTLDLSPSTLLESFNPRTSRHSHKLTSSLPSKKRNILLASILASILLLFLFVLTPLSLLSFLQLSTLPLSLLSKYPQIRTNYESKSTGQLSVFAVLSQVVGCLARVFTTVIEVGDWLLGLGYALALVLNVVLGVQLWLYWGNEGVYGEEDRLKKDIMMENGGVLPVEGEERVGREEAYRMRGLNMDFGSGNGSAIVWDAGKRD
ncbi:hypothetical protein VKT23_011055 [Stygiomarasmius scandens]|uniref:Mannose-P-dolichol utilization defect 1 protein homolog n=1 Tax=Marasmiellus scandens TaxID=2682957 RepID=A0ABR1JAK7_9AGAR